MNSNILNNDQDIENNLSQPQDYDTKNTERKHKLKEKKFANEEQY
jgi:hypothetical protein